MRELKKLGYNFSLPLSSIGFMETPLHFAYKAGKKKLAKFLLEDCGVPACTAMLSMYIRWDKLSVPTGEVILRGLLRDHREDLIERFYRSILMDSRGIAMAKAVESIWSVKPELASQMLLDLIRVPPYATEGRNFFVSSSIQRSLALFSKLITHLVKLGATNSLDEFGISSYDWAKMALQDEAGVVRESCIS